MQSRQPDLIASLAATVALSTIALALRGVARRMTRMRLSWDDYFALASYLFAWIWNAMLILWLDHGLGKRLVDIPAKQEDVLETAYLILFISELAYAASLAFAKFAVLAFYWRLFKTSMIRIPIQVLSVLSVLWLILRTLVAIFHCVPVQGFWDHSINARCDIDDSNFFFYSVLAHFFLDVVILVLPGIQVRKLHLPLSQKIGITGLFMFGTIVCICSVMVMHLSLSFDAKSPEMNWNIAPIWVWATAEMNLAVVSACLPILRPVFLVVTRLGSMTGSSNKYSLNVTDDPKKHSIKLKTFQNTFHQSRNKERGESDSTYQLAEDAETGSFNSDSDNQGIGARIFISKGDDVSRASQMPKNGILVHNETKVQVSSASSPHEQQ